MAFQKNSSSSSSSSSSFRWRFDIFVSYTGSDSKDLKNHLINYLKKKGLKIFKDDESERGQSLNPLLDSAIEGSRASIVLFSENYAKSEWCLNELVKILQCKDMNRQLVFPIFYKVEPWVVRKQRGKYHVAMADYEIKFKDQLDKVMNWRKALSTVASITGWEIHSNEAQLIDEIAEKVSRKIANQEYLYEAENPVGLQPRVSELNSILDVENDKIDVKVVVVYGPQGIGKSTIAKAAYNKNAHLFEGSSFLANVSENSKQPLHDGVLKMQKTLLSEIQNDQTQLELGNVDKGTTLIKKMIGSRKVLLVFDDVNSLDDLRSLPHKADWFGKGSRIIVTTRDQHQLKFRDFLFVSTCEVKKLDDHEAFGLFCLNAFGNETVRDGFVELAKRAVEYADGFPLNLIKWGSSLRETSKDKWDSELEDYRRNNRKKGILTLNDEVQKVNLNSDRVFQQKELRERENVIISQDENGKKIRLLSARELSIEWSHRSEYWSWISLPDSRFSEVAKLIEVYYFNIMGKIEIEELSLETTYAAYFVFKFEEKRRGFREREVNLVISRIGSGGGGEQRAFLDPQKNARQLCRTREDGWMEIKMGEFFITDGDYGAINCSLIEHDVSVLKTGLIVGGIEFRPKSIEPNSMSIPQVNNGKICYMLPARKLSIEWGQDSKYWRWISKPESRFSEVAKLHSVYHFDIKGKIASKILSSRTMYVVYFVFKFDDGPVLGFKEKAIQLSVNCGRGKVKRSAFLDPPNDTPKLCRERGDGWREIMMGEFCINDGDDGKIKCHLMEHDTFVEKKGLIVEGIEFRPKVY